MSDNPIQCPDCAGEGILDGEPCDTCDGSGTVEKQMSEGKTVPYFKRLHALLKEHVKDFVTESDFMEMTKKARAHAGGVAKAAKRKETMMGEESYGDIQREVEAAFQAQFNTGPDYRYWVRDVYPSGYLIACDNRNQKLYRVPFMEELDSFTFGQFQEVEEEKDYVPVSASEGYRVFVELSRYAEPPEWIPYLPKPGSFNHPEYGKIKITKERNTRFIDNFASGVYQSQLPINAEHKPNEEGAYGWITGMRLNTDDSVDARVNWTDLGDKAIRNDRFKYISPEWFDTWEKKSTGEKIEDVASGAALTVRPFFKEDSLRALVANEHGLFAITDKQPRKFSRVVNDRGSKLYFTALEPTTEVREMADENPAKTGMNADEAQRFTELEKQFNEYKTANETKVKELTESVAAKDAEVKAASERVVALEKDARTKRFNETVRDFSGDRVAHLKFMESIAEKFGEESDEFKHYVTQSKATAEQLRQSAIFDEYGTDAGGAESSPEAQLEAATQKIMSEDKTLTHAKAYSLACERNPKIYAEHRQATRNVAN